MTPLKKYQIDLGDGVEREVRISAAKQMRLDEEHRGADGNGSYFGACIMAKWYEALPLVSKALATALTAEELVALAELTTRDHVAAAIDAISLAINGKTTEEVIALAIDAAKNAQRGDLPPVTKATVQ